VVQLQGRSAHTLSDRVLAAGRRHTHLLRLRVAGLAGCDRSFTRLPLSFSPVVCVAPPLPHCRSSTDAEDLGEYLFTNLRRRSIEVRRAHFDCCAAFARNCVVVLAARSANKA
jgi:hypothetical protein